MFKYVKSIYKYIRIRLKLSLPNTSYNFFKFKHCETKLKFLTCCLIL